MANKAKKEKRKNKYNKYKDPNKLGYGPQVALISIGTILGILTIFVVALLVVFRGLIF
ncbi:MAG TPA: hypothetical protein VFD28_01785 [Candidatus Eisenbacteria bacterium]|nr:hypothetical protein [Candidatus Eisenbacteria bacterium]